MGTHTFKGAGREYFYQRMISRNFETAKRAVPKEKLNLLLWYMIVWQRTAFIVRKVKRAKGIYH